jgi:hypothetical protein
LEAFRQDLICLRNPRCECYFVIPGGLWNTLAPCKQLTAGKLPCASSPHAIGYGKQRWIRNYSILIARMTSSTQTRPSVLKARVPGKSPLISNAFKQAKRKGSAIYPSVAQGRFRTSSPF